MPYIAIQANAGFGIEQYDILRVTSNPEVYECAQNPDVQLGLVTILANPDYFTEVLILDAQTKLEALADRINGATWTPAVGDYFTDIDDTLTLYQIIDDNAPSFQYIRISGGAIDEDEAAQTGFDDTRVPIIFDESGSGS